jgi:choline dehydrogenase
MAIHPDVLIVGAGSAGCVLAARLSEDGARRVALIEAGGPDDSLFIRMPAGLAAIARIKGINWRYRTEPEAELNGRRLYWPRGRVLGGSSSINAMIYMRGQPADYDGWAASGARGWAFSDVLPYFLRAEDQARGPSALHGVGGPLAVSDLRDRCPLAATFIAAATAAGLAENPDFNGATQEGCGWYQVTQRDGERASASRAYLAPALTRPNLTVTTRAQVLRVLFEGERAVGVELVRDGRREEIRAGEVILAGGAINSPQLLLLSGVGPAAELEALGIKVRHALPGVGKNLQDHLDYCTLYQATVRTYDFSVLEALGVLARYLLTRRGPGTSNFAEAGAFARSPGADRPDLQLHFVPAQLDDHGRNRLPGHGFTIHACVLRPRSRGEIKLKSVDPLAPPAIHARYLSEAVDLELLLEGIALSRRIARAEPFAGIRRGELYPGEGVSDRAGLIAAVRAKAETIYHPVGTCRMGTDPLAVVDPALRVRGLDGLRVVDASVMPTLVSGNTNAPTIMIAEKVAAAMRGA